MDNFAREFNGILIETYHNILLMEETKKKYSSASFSFRDRNAAMYLAKYNEGKTLSEVAAYLRISRPSATVLVKKLSKHGFVRKFSEPGNERSTMVALTKKGKLFAAYQRRYMKRMAAMVRDGLNEEEQEILYKGLCKLNNFFADTIDEMAAVHSSDAK